MKKKKKNNNLQQQQQQQQQGKEKKFYVRDGQSILLQNCLSSKSVEDITPRKALNKRLQQKREPTGNKYPTYSEKWLIVNEMVFPSNRVTVSSLSVISTHSCFSGLDSLKRMRTRASDISMSVL